MITRALLPAMATKPKGLPKAEVFATHTRIAEAFRAQLENAVTPPPGEFPFHKGRPDTRADVLLKIWGRTYDACKRLRQAGVKVEPPYRPEDDPDRESASLALMAAVASIKKAESIFKQHSAEVNWGVHPFRGAHQFEKITEKAERGMQPLILGAQPKHRAARLNSIALELECLIHETRITQYVKEISTEYEWDELLTDFAVEMHDAGFGDARIAEILVNITDADGAAAIYQRRRRRRLGSRQPTRRVPEA